MLRRFANTRPSPAKMARRTAGREAAPLLIGRGRFLVLFPENAHAPCLPVGASARVKKCVAKVLADR